MATINPVEVETFQKEVSPLPPTALDSRLYGPRVVTAEERAAALSLLTPSFADAILGAGWDDVPSPPQPSSPRQTSYKDPTSFRNNSYSSSSSASSSSSSSSTNLPGEPSTPPSTTPLDKIPVFQPRQLTEALLVRSCRQGWERAFELHRDWPKPEIQIEDEILIRNKAVGLNPVDWKSVSYNFGIADWPWVLGRDIAGVVEGVGEGVKGFKKGDRVWTCADSRDSRAGGYQRYSVARSATVARIPDNVTDDQAATIGTGLITAAVVLHWFFKIPLPTEIAISIGAKDVGHEEDDWLVIYGGGAITGIYAAQLAKLSGLKVLSVASPSNFEYLKSLGVTECVDRFGSEEEILDSIHQKTGGRLGFAIDCVGSKTSATCYRALKRAGGNGRQGHGQMVCLAGNPKPEVIESKIEGRDVKVHKISFSTTFYGDEGFSNSLLRSLEQVLEQGRLLPAKPEVVKDGLAGIRRGLESLRDGSAPRAKKLIIRVDETPPADLTYLGVRSEISWNGVV
ncbi:GroES-like protein [Violaceomyces palustris]|uniref:GroES-like protein n=1 Tax=Violaceomyces palustris TaxID=1673888 RepID=A0ACD0P5F2_9BASI|nr:GroES-like protein [Violaceomyces palustris]